MGVLGDLPSQSPTIGLRHPVLRLDELIRRNPRFERGELLGILKALNRLRLLQFGGVHGALLPDFPSIRRPIGQRIRQALI
jgi:hypothetical protein